MLVPGIAKMCSMQWHTLEEVQYKAISAMVLKLLARREYGNELRITGLRDAFKSGSIEELGVVGDQRIKDLAIMLNPYSRGGQYERFFEGRNNIDFSNDFIVIENEELKRRPDLHAVVNILLLHRLPGDAYLTRNRRKVLFVDELKQQLGDIGADDPVKAAVIEELHGAPAVRRCARHGNPERRRLLRLDPDGSGLQLLGLGFPAPSETGVHRNARPQGPADHGRTEEAPAQFPLRTEAGVFSELRTSRRRSAKASPATSSIRPPICCSPISWKTTPRSTSCATRACPSTRRSANCCAIGGIRYETKHVPTIAPWLADAIRGVRRPDRLRPSRPAPCAGDWGGRRGRGVLRQEAEFTQILTKASSGGRPREKHYRSWTAPSSSACRSPSRNCRANAVAWSSSKAVAGPTPNTVDLTATLRRKVTAP